MVILTKYAPGQSAKNNIEHLWAPTTSRLASVILYPGASDDAAGDDGAEVEEEVRAQKKVGNKTVETDEDIETVKRLLSDFEFSGYKVEPVAVRCESDEVEIGGKVLQTTHYNEIKSWKNFFFGKKLTRARMDGANSNPEEKKMRKELRNVCSHIDKRAHRLDIIPIISHLKIYKGEKLKILNYFQFHSVIIRKCLHQLGEKVCKLCQKNPPKLSEAFIKALPSR